MDLYRYFHPHYNPRLKATPLRLQELGELEQAATELKRALERAKLRISQHSVGGIRTEHLDEILIAMNYVVESLGTLTNAHPGDDNETMAQLLRERADAPGWENWARLLKQRLSIAGQYETMPESSSSLPSSK
jgi:hypothetical protein